MADAVLRRRRERKSRTLATFDLARQELARLEVDADEERIRHDRLGTGAMTVADAFALFMARRRCDPNNTERRFEIRGRIYGRHFRLHTAAAATRTRGRGRGISGPGGSS